MDTALKKNILIAILAVAGVLLLAAAGWLLYFKLQFTTYHDDQYRFTIKYPKSWQVIVRPKDTVAVVFMRPKDTALDTIQENFNITIQPLPNGMYTLKAFSDTAKAQMQAVFGKNVHMVDKDIHIGWRDGHELSVDAPKPDHLKMVNAWTLRSTDVCIMTFIGDINKYPQDSLYVHEMIHSLELS